MPDHEGGDRGQGIAYEATDDRGDEAFQADQEIPCRNTAS